MTGEFASLIQNVNFGSTEAFAGAELRESRRSSTLITLRRSAFAGYATVPGLPPPDFTSSC